MKNLLIYWTYLVSCLFLTTTGFAVREPAGIEPSMIPALESSPPPLPNPKERMIQTAQKYPDLFLLEKYLWGERLENFDWENMWSEVGFELAGLTFSPSEILEHFCLNPTSSRVQMHWQRSWLYGRFLYTIQSSLQSFSGVNSYTSIAQIAHALRSLTPPSQFEYRYDVVSELGCRILPI